MSRRRTTTRRETAAPWAAVEVLPASAIGGGDPAPGETLVGLDEPARVVLGPIPARDDDGRPLVLVTARPPCTSCHGALHWSYEARWWCPRCERNGRNVATGARRAWLRAVLRMLADQASAR